MSVRERFLSTLGRNQDDISIFNVSFPLESNSSESCVAEEMEYEPELADLLRSVECPVCRTTPNPPIYNCINGHFSCGSCRPRLPLDRCPCCLAKFTKMRNFPLENLVMARVFFCDFRNVGCQKRDMSMIEYEEHMKKCWFHSLANPVNCSARRASSATQPQETTKSAATVNSTFCCPRCNFTNSKRKLKCQNCQINLRVPTPMCSRPPWAAGAGSQVFCSTDSL